MYVCMYVCVLYTQPQTFFNASTEKNVVFTASYAV